ncbi:MAG: hypothetical protein U0744_21650 [Gemmataceae bacterium]
MTLLQSFWELLTVLGNIGRELGDVALRHSLWIIWIAWWLWAVNWRKGWAVLREGGWAPLVLLVVLTATVWSAISPGGCPSCGLPNFWYQLVFVSGLVGVAFLCGWLQGVFGWTPAEIDLDPPAHSHGHGDHGHGHGGHH